MPHPHSYARVPSPCSEWPQAGDPAQDQAEAAARTLLITSAQAEVPIPVHRVRGGREKGRGRTGQPANAGGAACPFDGETDGFVGRV